jgi:hypothetical protein
MSSKNWLCLFFINPDSEMLLTFARNLQNLFYHEATPTLSIDGFVF